MYKNSVKPKNNALRKSVSLQFVVNDWAKEIMEKQGYGEKFSMFVSDLIRRENEKLDSIKTTSFT
jgi:hypothetical protein